jgi:hypothetical protein
VEVERLEVGAEWDAWVAAAGLEGDFLQTSYWAQIDKAANGRDACAVRVGEVGVLVGRQADSRGALSALHGPVFATNELGSLSALLAGLETLARELGAREVNLVGRPPCSRVSARDIAAILIDCGYSETPWRTSVVNLERGDEDLLRSFDRAVGKAVRRCERAGVSVVICDRDVFERKFLSAFAEANPDYDRRRDLSAFVADGGRHYSYRIAVDKEGTVLGTLGAYRFGGVGTEIMSARTAAGRLSELPVQDLLHWETMRWHRDQGDVWFDLAGHTPVPSSPKEAGIRRFKLKWHGDEIDSPIFTKVVTSKWRRARDRLAVRVS